MKQRERKSNILALAMLKSTELMDLAACPGLNYDRLVKR